ncbi:MAG: bile acid:sodium symporter family protein [Bacteroidales bacterium]|jgi:bile acid:Na+ symporter, BASS family|nr:bile acid:sodium symporter family protein [Bacteroidales bacterium]MDG1901704.1 bile acid:sodium symporter family protein [Bacteroidales bacterium]MDG2080300.1 bile acid:sodium symporter family protein [Bacteroidales bacterium]|tara:strand:+ start:12844 stop:13818 length:975 start_codon:yes stop_codon:yes gene_type:complete
MDSLHALDEIRLNFSSNNLYALNIAIAFVMFGVALEIKLEHFVKLLKNPKSAFIGVFSQFLMLPFLTFLLILLLRNYLTPTMALGMILVSACPGGNISNFISSLAKGNVALSISLTAIATLGAIFFTPLNFAFWGKLTINFFTSQDPAMILQPIQIDPYQMFQTVVIILGIPLIFGIFINTKFPKITSKMVKPIKQISILLFAAIVIIALVKNFDYFKIAIGYIFFIVLIHNAMAIGSGYFLGYIGRRPIIDRKTIAIETGIQNSGLALVLIFNPNIFSPDLELGGMAIIAGWWGIWHIIGGLAIAGYWSRFSISSRENIKVKS